MKVVSTRTNAGIIRLAKMKGIAKATRKLGLVRITGAIAVIKIAETRIITMTAAMVAMAIVRP